MLSEHNHTCLVRVRHKVHSAAHALHQLARDHVIRKVTVRCDLQSTKHGHIEVATAYNAKAVG